jgi:hypothetical protein
VALRLRPMADFGPEQYEVVFEADMSGASILPTDTIGIRGLSPAPPPEDGAQTRREGLIRQDRRGAPRAVATLSLATPFSWHQQLRRR